MVYTAKCMPKAIIALISRYNVKQFGQGQSGCVKNTHNFIEKSEKLLFLKKNNRKFR